MLSITNITAYRFIRLPSDFLHPLRDILAEAALQLAIRGTILLSVEGINLFLAGKKGAITQFQNLLESFDYFKNLVFKESISDFIPFQKMQVKIKKEIIPCKVDILPTALPTAPSIPPETLSKWLTERVDFVLLDVRNAFEVALGSFVNAIHLDLQHFREFPKSVQKLHKTNGDRPIVMFCTGGIRCEKASALLLQAGFSEVYQLEGGILNYFKKCGKHHYNGLCFVFDSREALTPSLTVANAGTKSSQFS